MYIRFTNLLNRHILRIIRPREEVKRRDRLLCFRLLLKRSGTSEGCEEKLSAKLTDEV